MNLTWCNTTAEDMNSEHLWLRPFIVATRDLRVNANFATIYSLRDPHSRTLYLS